MTPALREQLTVKALAVACNTMERVIGQSCNEASSKIVKGRSVKDLFFRGRALLMINFRRGGQHVWDP